MTTPNAARDEDARPLVGWFRSFVATPWISGAVLLAAFGIMCPIGVTTGGLSLTWSQQAVPLVFAWGTLIVALTTWLRPPESPAACLGFALAALLASIAPLALLGSGLGASLDAEGWGAGFWCQLAAVACLAGGSLRRVAGLGRTSRVARLTPLLFGAWVLIAWQIGVRAFDVPPVLLPAPSAVGGALAASGPVLWDDVVQTVLRAALTGLAVGATLGFATAVAIDRSPFLQRGLLPLAALASAVPLVGIAPIMVMWFGFDWPSKAAVVALMTFFPMLTHTLAGLGAAGRLELDLMRSYGAGYLRTLVALRLPVAAPFVFAALKIDSTLALIGAIVAEFFGSPTAGLGFRISTEAARLNMPLVWAAIAVAALAGSALYGSFAAVERRATFWHPSIRSRG